MYKIRNIFDNGYNYYDEEGYVGSEYESPIIDGCSTFHSVTDRVPDYYTTTNIFNNNNIYNASSNDCVGFKTQSPLFDDSNIINVNDKTFVETQDPLFNDSYNIY